MVLKIADKNKKLMTVRATPHGTVLTKGKRTLYLQHNKSVNQNQKAKEVIAKNSFDSLFKKGKHMRLIGSNSSFVKLK